MDDILRIQIKDECIEMWPPLDGLSRDAVDGAGVGGITDFGDREAPDGSPSETFGFANMSDEVVRGEAERIANAVRKVGREVLFIEPETEGRSRILDVPRAKRHGGTMLRRLVRA